MWKQKLLLQENFNAKIILDNLAGEWAEKNRIKKPWAIHQAKYTNS